VSENLKRKKMAKQYHRVESHYGTFSRSFSLPDNVNDNSINASYNNGILNVTVDKSEEKLKKQIKIKVIKSCST
jgi:HSP20 family protein